MKRIRRLLRTWSRSFRRRGMGRSLKRRSKGRVLGTVLHRRVAIHPILTMTYLGIIRLPYIFTELEGRRFFY